MFEEFEKNALKRGESDIGSPGKKIKTFDDLASKPKKEFNTFDDIAEENNNKPKTFDDFRVDSKSGINTFDDLRKKSKAQDKIDQEKIKKIEDILNKSEAQNYKEKVLKDFENVEIKFLSELPYWEKIDKFLENHGINDGEVIVVGDDEKWKNIFGSNDSKSSSKPKAIILKKEIFDKADISNENISWLIHEIGHIEFYKSLGEKLDEFMEGYYKKGEYTTSEMEKEAFKLQFEFLKSIGKTKKECLDFTKQYIEESFSENEKDEKNKELKKIEEYISRVF